MSVKNFQSQWISLRFYYTHHYKIVHSVAFDYIISKKKKNDYLCLKLHLGLLKMILTLTLFEAIQVINFRNGIRPQMNLNIIKLRY